ncbi:MAG: YfiR family protein, partial [Chthoniobacteraceae bacterium]
ICSALESSHVLCVGDTEETEQVAAINFSVADGRTVFTVNLAHAARAGVRISSKLLALAQSVRGPRENASR